MKSGQPKYIFLEDNHALRLLFGCVLKIGSEYGWSLGEGTKF